MNKITKVHARQVFDSRGNPTIEAEVTLDNNVKASFIVPSGASTGAFEAHELRDNDKNYFLGKSVLKAVNNVNSIISEKIINQEATDQKKIDEIFSPSTFLRFPFDSCITLELGCIVKSKGYRTADISSKLTFIFSEFINIFKNFDATGR